MKKLSQILKEISPKTAVFVFGRMNPPTRGHEVILRTLLSTAEYHSATPFLFLSCKQDTNNPLSPKDKVKYLNLGMSEISPYIVCDGTIKDPFDAIVYMSKLGYKNIIMLAGADRKAEFENSITPYLKHKDKSLRLPVDHFKVESVGFRNHKSKGVEGVSGTKQREYAKKDAFASFCKGTMKNLSPKFQRELFLKIQKFYS